MCVALDRQSKLHEFHSRGMTWCVTKARNGLGPWMLNEVPLLNKKDAYEGIVPSPIYHHFAHALYNFIEVSDSQLWLP